MGTICQKKVNKMGTFLVKICYLKGRGIGPRDGAFPYKTLLGTHPLGENMRTLKIIKTDRVRQTQSGFIMCFLSKNDFSNYHR